MTNKSRQIVIRTDASTSIGTGHVMRTLTLADALSAKGAVVSFISRVLPGHLCDHVEAKGYHVHRLRVASEEHGGCLPTDRPNDRLSDVDWRSDAFLTSEIIARFDERPEWLIVDHYALPAEWETRMRSGAERLMAIDDLVDRNHDCDLLLDQNFHEDQDACYKGLIPDGCVKLFGPEYALLRPTFRQARNVPRPDRDAIRRMLVFFGGSDPTNETAKALHALKLLNRPDIVVDVVVGASNPNRAEIERHCHALPSSRFYCQVDNMAELMMAADLAICAGGSVTWERCCVGLPGMVIAVAKNQERVAQALAKAGLICFLGRSSEVSVAALAEALRRLFTDQAGLRAMAAKSRLLTDGCGADRVAAAMNDSYERPKGMTV